MSIRHKCLTSSSMRYRTRFGQVCNIALAMFQAVPIDMVVAAVEIMVGAAMAATVAAADAVAKQEAVGAAEKDGMVAAAVGAAVVVTEDQHLHL